jgi:methylated-DNA-[protein]-cysteine S-methyltransferase
MTTFMNYDSPLGNILLTAENEALTSLGFAKKEGAASHSHPILREATRWLDIYFAGQDPGFTPKLRLQGTPFQMEVWRLLLDIPFGTTTTYGTLAKAIARRRGIQRMAAQAVGGAVGRNPIALIVPCHRVIGSDNSLTGYGGGLDKKTRLLALEGIHLPKDAL